MTATQGRNIIPNKGGESFTVHQHIILKNFWEYYLGETDKDGVAFGYVMGFENEWGSVPMDEIKPYIISKTSGAGLDEIMPPEGYLWEDEKPDPVTGSKNWLADGQPQSILERN